MKPPRADWSEKPEDWHEPEQAEPSIAKPLIVCLLIIVFAGAMLGWFFAGQARAHDAIPTAAQPNGWKYPTSCCSFRDCRATKSAEVEENDKGFRLASTGEFVPHGDKRIKELSQDGEIHVCQQAGNFDAGRILCLLIPPRSF